MADGLRQHVEHRAHPRQIGLAQRPGRLLVDIPVRSRNDLPERLERAVERLFGEIGAQPAVEPTRLGEQRLVGGGEGLRRRQASLAIAVDHRQHALRQIAEIIGEIAVDAVDHGAVREIAVAAERQLAQHEIAQRIERRIARPAAGAG